MLTKIKRENLIIAYKLLHDTLLISLIFFLLALMGEGAIPGIVTSHVGFSKIIAAIFFNLAAIYFLAGWLQFKIETSTISKKTAYPLLFLALILVFNSLLKTNIFLNIFLLLIFAATGFFTYKVIFEEN